MLAEWNLAEIFHVVRRDDEFDKSKYRSVSTLILLDKVFKRCVQKQFVHYLNRICVSSCQHKEKVTVASLCCCILSRTGKELLARSSWLGP